MARSYTVNINVDDPTNAVWFQKVGNITSQNQYFPNTIYGEASFDLTAFFWHGDVGIDGTPEAGTTPANFVGGDTLTLKGRIEDQPSGIAPVDLATGSIVISTNEILFDVQPNIVPNEWSQVDLDTTAKYPIAIWFTGTHEGDEITAKTNVIVIDKNHVGTGDALTIDASDLTYTPADNADWVVVPTLMNEGLDELADRVQTIEDNPASGDMSKAVYDPQLIEGDAFDRGDHTGTQLSATISDLSTTINTSTGVSGTVTIHSDINSAGRGDIITSAEGVLVADYDNHRVAVNPHNITPAIVGSTTAQWNANQIQGYVAPIPSGVADDQKAIVFDDTTGQFLLATMPGQGGGEANDLVLLGTGENIRASKVGTDINIKGITGAGTISVTTVSDNIQIDLPASAEGVVGGVALANATNVSNLDNNVAISPFRVADMIGDKADSDLTINTAVVDYTLLTGDKNAVVEITNSITIPVLTAGYSCLVYNSSSSASTITLSGTTIDNTTDLNISANGSMSVIYLSTTRVIIDGNTEA